MRKGRDYFTTGEGRNGAHRIFHRVPFLVKPFLPPSPVEKSSLSSCDIQIQRRSAHWTKRSAFALRRKVGTRRERPPRHARRRLSWRDFSLCYDGLRTVDVLLFGGNLKILSGFRVATAMVAVASVAWGLTSTRAGAQARTTRTLESVFHEMDAQAKDFHSVSADIDRTKVTVVVNDKSTETGTIQVRGDRMLLELRVPSPRTILRSGDTLFVYNPGLKRVEEYNLGKNRALLDQFLLLGFGTDSQEMKKAYLVTLLKEDKIDDRRTIQLELTPKVEAVRSQISKIQIWLDEASWLPVQQEFFEAGSGDYSIVKYSKVVRNPDLPDSKFKPRWPKGTEKIKPQG